MIDIFKGKTLGIVSSKKLWIDSEGIKTTGGFGRQVEAFAQYFNSTIDLHSRFRSFSYILDSNTFNVLKTKIYKNCN
jgi:hypothetical protein